MKIEFYHTFRIPEKNVNIEGQWDLNPTVKFLQQHVKVQGKTVMDIACRDGFYGFQFEKMGAKQVSGLDLDDRLARRYIKSATGSKNDFIHANAYSLNKFMPGMADVTFAGDVICHLQDPIRFLRNVHHVTKEHFYIVADVWPQFETWYAGYPFKLTKKEILFFLELAGFIEITPLCDYQIIGEYWRRRGCQAVRDVMLVRCKANPAWKFGAEEGIMPQNGTENEIPELTHEVDWTSEP